MGQNKPKQFTHPPKKIKSKASEPQTADDFQSAADLEEEAGGKWRAGDPAKSARAFIRAIDLYERGLDRHPKDFDLAYNKARLMLELTQQPTLLPHLAVSLQSLLETGLEDHRRTLRLDSENVDALFNTAQVLTSLAEVIQSHGEDEEQPTRLLHEALEVLSTCLSKQEMMLEQQRIDVAMESDAMSEDVAVAQQAQQPASSSETEEQTATIIAPLTVSDLLDTVHASLAALTTLVTIDDASELGALADMAEALTETKAPSYINLLPEVEQDTAQLTTALDRAIFYASLADARFSAYMIDLKTFVERLQIFDFPGKEQNAHALFSEAQAREELVLSAIDQAEETGSLDGIVCWSQLAASQKLLSTAASINTDDARERKAKIYELKADVEVLRYRLATSPDIGLSEAVRNSSLTLLSNARTFYKGAAEHGRALGEEDIVAKSMERHALLDDLSQAASRSDNDGVPEQNYMEALRDLVEDGLLSPDGAEQILERLHRI